MNIDEFEGHTPAPWTYLRLSDTYAVITGKDDWILRVDVENEGVSLSEADAKLIAAAPDLLKEVKHLRSKVRQLIQSDLQLLNKHGDCYYCGHDMMQDIPSCGVKHTEKNPTVDEIFEKEMKR